MCRNQIDLDEVVWEEEICIVAIANVYSPYDLIQKERYKKN